MALCLPIDAVTGASIDVDLASDFLELSAFFAPDSTVRTSDLANAASLGAEEDHVDVQNEMQEGEEEIVYTAVNRIDSRLRALGVTYPFALDTSGDVLTCELEEQSFGQAAYILSLVLSNLQAASPVLKGSGHHPDEAEVRQLRAHFQYCATVALAAEVQGDAWSFGSPRPDGSAFLESWSRYGDGSATGSSRPRQERLDSRRTIR